jgi:hypothetical protein
MIHFLDYPLISWVLLFYGLSIFREIRSEIFHVLFADPGALRFRLYAPRIMRYRHPQNFYISLRVQLHKRELPATHPITQTLNGIKFRRTIDSGRLNCT